MSFMAKPDILCSSASYIIWLFSSAGRSGAKYYDQKSFSVVFPSWARKYWAASAALLGRSAKAYGALHSRFSKVYLRPPNILYKRKGLLAAICSACLISSRAARDSVCASFAS